MPTHLNRPPLRTLVVSALAAMLLGAAPQTFANPTPAPSAGPLLTDADEIFAKARKAWSIINYSRYASYTIATTFRLNNRPTAFHYEAIEDVRRGIVFAHTFSREEIADPSVPHGFNFAVGSVNGQGGFDTNPEHPGDPIGPMALGVSYDFGISLIPQKTTVVNSTKDIEFPPRLQTIGVAATTEHQYTVKLLEMLDNGQTYHLGLTPVRDPDRLRLRELWVDAKTFLTKKALISGNFSGDPYDKVPWLIEFTQIGGAAYISTETAEAPLDFDGASLPNVVISFTELQLLNDLPRYGSIGTNDDTHMLTEP